VTLPRRIHLLLGVFFAPSILFFAFTGALQTLGLQDRRGDTPPPAWIAHVSQVHVHQTWAVRHRQPPPNAQAARPAEAARPQLPAEPEDDEQGEALGHELLQGFIVLMSTGLMVTTLIGLYMAWQMRRDRKVSVVLFILGAAVPIALLFL
jgi:hypothetical protein